MRNFTVLLRRSAAMEKPNATKHKTTTRRCTSVDPFPSPISPFLFFSLKKKRELGFSEVREKEKG